MSLPVSVSVPVAALKLARDVGRVHEGQHVFAREVAGRNADRRASDGGAFGIGDRDARIDIDFAAEGRIVQALAVVVTTGGL